MELLYNRYSQVGERIREECSINKSIRYGKKIWLTEFAVCCTRDEASVIEFAKVSQGETL